jgi:hypothetical protein
MSCGKNGFFARHWFTVNSRIGGGDPTPVCVRCGAPRARPLTDAEWKELRAQYHFGELTNSHVTAALSRYFGADL